ncbi:LacI family DNA-binding transcriptional regulator [Christiangramia salexigens]|uniref:LacI family transcriptional regulator n=1 Tax=Christiangramia salexigens TaxID=1913577 RepID=A0A1L3J7F0_9FLAO|nr:LacI family DNA-binding transcriptional regulator [Christiangramia salexigens]APG61048.1 LacI family transcriptional regulator [Christiangramia salexigens]
MKKKKKISIKDISKELGISITTISFIINKKAENKISKEVIKKVEDYIEKVGYTPNSSAQSLRTGKSKTIVFMAEDISDPFFSAIAKQMEEIAFDNGYKIIYCSTENKKERAIELLDLFKDRQVDAFIITPPEGFEEEMKKLIYEQHQTVMVFDRYYKSFEHNYVVLDNLRCAKDATRSLYDSGKKQLAFIGINSELSPIVHRYEGYLESIRSLELQEFSLMLKFEEIKTEQGRKKISSFLDKYPQIDGILFASNNLAINGLRVLKQKNTRIPEEIGIISFDERDIFELYSPPISVVSQPIEKLAGELIKGTLSLLQSKAGKSEIYQKTLEGTLIPRESISLKNPASS